LRIVERSNKKQRSIYIQRDELAWLVGAVEEVMDVDTSEVFWDQSRAGYPRILAQNRSNRHGRFKTIEEFEGRNRRGSVLMVKVGLVLYRNLERQDHLCGRVVSLERVRWSEWSQVGGAMRRWWVLSNSPEDICFPEYNEPIARIPRWLKEVSASAAAEGPHPAKVCSGQV
jgi:hypothetical protein